MVFTVSLICLLVGSTSVSEVAVVVSAALRLDELARTSLSGLLLSMLLPRFSTVDSFPARLFTLRM